MKKLYVGNLPFRASGTDLQDLFAAHGEVVSVQVVEERETGRSRGFGFVEMGSDYQARAAIDGLHDREYGARRLTVIEAGPREARAGYGGGYGGWDRSAGRDHGGYGGRH